MASIRKRGSAYLLVVSMGYDPDGRRRASQQKTVHPPEGLTPKAKEKWLEEQAMLFEREVKSLPPAVDKSMTLAEYVELWLREIAPGKLAKSTLARERQDIDRFLPLLGEKKLADLRPEHFRNLYSQLRKQKNQHNGEPLSESTIEGVHACLCGILTNAVEGGYLMHNPAWRAYKYSGKKKQKKKIADEETVQKLILALEQESVKYETYFKLIIATGMRRGECCGLRWSDIDWQERSIHIQRNVVKITGEEIFVKEPKTTSSNRYVYFSPEMESLLREYRSFCKEEARAYEEREISDNDYLFRKRDTDLPMTPTTFTWRFKLILKKHGLPTDLSVHSLRHTTASLMIARGTDVATVAGLLGHSQVSTTLDIYTHAFDSKKKEASQALQNSLEI